MTTASPWANTQNMTALRRYTIQVPIFVSVLLITLLSSYWLTGRYGLMGTAVGVLLGNLVQLLLSAAVVWQATRGDNMRAATDLCTVIGTAGSEP